jgi:SNF2 family DNA or RNA helicase
MKTEDVITLPETIPYEIKIKNIPQYKKFKKDRLIEIEEIELVGDTSLTTMLYLRQLAGMYNKHKYEKITELLEGTDDRIIIFYNFKYECSELIKICKKLNKPVSIVSGDTRDLKNYESENDTVILVQYQAGAMGLNLQRSNKIIYFSLPLSSELFEQSKKRTHRIGQERTCLYYYLITTKSIEEDILETLKMRKDYTDKLFDG